jgi:hypothetical protein
MKRKNLLMSSLSVIIVFMTSCATIFTGTKQTVQINSTPSGAMVLIDGIDHGTTPAAIKLRKNYYGQTITLKSDGYETKILQPKMEYNVVSGFNLFNILGFGIDAATGALWKYAPTSYEIELIKRCQ